MKKSILRYLTIGAMGILTATSCTDYLDKEADSDVNPEEAFKNFTNFQGFVEEIYNCIPSKESNMWCCTFNWGEDEIMNAGLGDSHLTAQLDLGNYRNWYGNNQHYLHADANVLNPTSKDKYHHSIEHAWYCIRKANVGLQNMDLMSDASKDERNAVEGQLYFFRAWWHEEQMIWFGGIPYIDQQLDPSGDLYLPRLTFAEDADKAYDDFMKAASLLPANWDKNSAGQATKGQNDLRVTKATALAYAGKVMLWSASPLNNPDGNNGKGELGGKNTYNYNVERAKKAAEALGQAIALVEEGKTPYSLAPFEYEEVTDWEKSRGIYDHIPAAGSTDNYSDIWRTTGKNWRQPGSTEAMMRTVHPTENSSNWNFTKLWGTKINGIVEHDAVIHMPTANYINYAYGMANGQPAYIVKNGELVINPESGFDPTHPFKDRDPRFYHDIIFDGFRYINADPGDDAAFQYCQMYTGGNLRDNSNGTRTGYYCQKLVPHQANKYDGMYNWGGALQCDLPYMRLAEVYLLYAEACAAAGGPSYSASSCGLSSADAINRLRDRVGAGQVDASLSGNAYIDEVRRERACELAFEGFRWNDLQRWLLLTEKPYTLKTAQDFSRAGDFDFVKNDPAEAQVGGWSERVIVERKYQVKHYLLPFKNADVTLYPEFNQNPGW